MGKRRRIHSSIDGLSSYIRPAEEVLPTPSVIRLTKTDLIEFAQTLVFANTPLSLFKGMIGCSGMQKLRKYQISELIEYYDWITARGKRTEIVVGLAYAVLCALVLHARDTRGVHFDSSRLQWGERIWKFMERSTIATGRVTLDTSVQEPKISVVSSRPGETPGLLYGPDGQRF